MVIYIIIILAMNSLVSIQSPRTYRKSSKRFLPITDNTFSSNSLTVSSFSGNDAYQNGDYIAGASTTYSNQYPAYIVFNDVPKDTLTWGWVSQNNSYNASTGVYNGSNFTAVNGPIFGDWLQIQLPFQFYLSMFQLKNSGGDAGGGMPTIGYLLGSTNGTTWTELYALNHTSAYWYNNTELKNYSVSVPIPYNYYRLVFNQIGETNNAFASMLNFNLFGYI
jgi:hypothetical protein